jgi:hypothetical protein
MLPSEPYYSAYRGSVNAPDGSFNHFLRIVNPIHELKGYWRFHSIEDDRRAFSLGLSTPEMVLLAVDRGDGLFDEIILRWLPGSMDKGNKPSVGTAAAHLQSIYNERKLVGKPLSFRGRVPTYPIVTDPTDPTLLDLLNYRLVKYGLEKGNPQITCIVETHKQHARSQGEVAMSAGKQNGSAARQPSSGLPSPAFQGASSDSLTLPITYKPQDLSVPLDPDLFGSPTPHTRSSQQPRLSGSQLQPNSNSSTDGAINHILRSNSAQSSPGVNLVFPGNATVTIAESPEQAREFAEFSRMINDLPCMDCDEIGCHAWDCNIGSEWILPVSNVSNAYAYLGIKPLPNPNYEELVDAVTRFDPQPWTTHYGPLKQPDGLDLTNRTKEMAQTIRSLGSFTEDMELHALPDEVLMFMWALKVTPEVEIVQDYACGGSHPAAVQGLGQNERSLF